jgi:TolB protein
LASNTAISERRAPPAARGAAWLAAFALALAPSSLDVPAAGAQDEVRIDLEADGGRKIGIRGEAMTPAGDRAAARPATVTADPILASDLEQSTVFDVAKSWEGSGVATPGLQAVVTATLTVRGSSVTLSGRISDLPARRLIGKGEYRGTTAELRRLVHRFADDVVLQLTGEAGVAQTQIAYVAKAARSGELYVVDVDGHGARPLTAFKSPITSPTWAPNRGEVVFSSLRGSGWNLYGAPLRGGNSRQVTRAGNLNIAPAYSPDGGSIAFVSNKDGNSEIYVANRDGTGARRLTSNRAIDTSPAWAPHGQQIAFASDRGGSVQVYVMDRDGGNQRRLIQGFSYSDSPDWSPRGDRIAFVVRTGGGFDLYVANADGSGARARVTGRANENPRWSPDGRQIVFSSTRGGGRGLWITDLRGRSIRKLTVPGAIAANPAWSPRPAAATPGTSLGSTTAPNPGRTP